jgi:hypothetical protein
MAGSLERGGEWLLLSTAVARMSELHPKYQSQPGYANSDLETAIRADRVSLRGRPAGAIDHPPELFVEPITNNHRLNLIHNSLSARGRGSMGDNVLFRNVEVEWGGAEDYLRKLALARWPLQSEQNTPPETRSAITALKKTPTRRRGRQPTEREAVMQRMRDDLQQRRCSVGELRDMLQKNLVSKYGAGSRDTACKARDAILSEFAENSNPDK